MTKIFNGRKCGNIALTCRLDILIRLARNISAGKNAAYVCSHLQVNLYVTAVGFKSRNKCVGQDGISEHKNAVCGILVFVCNDAACGFFSRNFTRNLIDYFYICAYFGNNAIFHRKEQNLGHNLGQKLGFYFGHDEFRDMWQVEYGDPHFLFRYNHLDFLYSYNTDGYLAYWKMYIPFLSRGQNQWAYTLEGLKNKRYAYYYGSGKLPPGATLYETTKSLDSLPLYNGKKAMQLMKVRDFIDDSLSFRFCRSFGGIYRKLYIGATYDYRYTSATEGTLYRYVFTDGKNAYAIDSSTAYNDWLAEEKDSRLGLYIKFSNIRYEKIKNLHNVKWTEDIEKGYEIKAQISKNYEQIGANNNDIRLDLWTSLMLGRQMHHLTLKTETNFYLDHGKQHSLGGSNGFAGFPTGFYAGQARVFANLEQRYFSDFELATLRPVFAVFGSVGETAWDLEDINRKDLIYLTGFGIRLAQTKSISRLINKFDVSIPLNGVRKGEPHYSVITTYSL